MNLDLTSKYALETRSFQLAGCCLQLSICNLFVWEKIKNENWKNDYYSHYFRNNFFKSRLLKFNEIRSFCKFEVMFQTFAWFGITQYQWQLINEFIWWIIICWIKTNSSTFLGVTWFFLTISEFHYMYQPRKIQETRKTVFFFKQLNFDK